MLDWTCNTQQGWELQEAAHILFLPRVKILLRTKPLRLGKAGEFSSVLEVPEWLWCSVVLIRVFR